MNKRIEQNIQGILREIVDTIRDDLVALKKSASLEYMEQKSTELQRIQKSLSAALTHKNGLSIIAEIKRSSPSAGAIAEDVDIVVQAKSYEIGGAAAISVLTNKTYFDGSLEDLSLISQQCAVPLLRKDFIVDPYQVYEAYLAGADAVLLIAHVLTQDGLKELLELTQDLGMEALVETHSVHEIEKAKAAGARIIGVNARNLETFEIDLQHAIELAAYVPKDVVCIAESGIVSIADAKTVAEAGYDAALIGTALMKHVDPGAFIQDCTGL